MHRFIVVSLLLVAAFAGRAAAQSLEARAAEIRAAMDARDFERAERLVRDLRASDAALFAANNYDYLLGRLAERRGASAEASQLYLSLLKRNSNLSAYALWHLSALARGSGDLALERQYLTRLVGSFASSSLAPRARDRIIDSLIESNDHRAAASMLRPLASTTTARGRSRMADLADAYAKTGDGASARALYEQLIAGARDDYALAAAVGLDALDRAAGARPSEFEALRRARVYMHNRHWTEARAHFQYIAERFPDSPNRGEALYQTGFAFYREDNQDEAVKWFDRAHAEFPDKEHGEQGFYYVGTALQKARRYDESARRYMDFIAAYPDSQLIEAAYRNVVDSLRYAGKDAEAIEWSRRIASQFAGRGLAGVGLFNEARIEMARGNYAAALALLTRLQAQPVNPKLVSAPGRGEAAFLRIVALEQMGRLSEAAQLYLALPDHRDNYLGQRATERLQALAKTSEGRRVIEPLARNYREQARAALAAGRYAEAKEAATQALRLAADETSRRDLLQILRACYSQLPAYRAASRYRLIPAARAAVTSPERAVTGASNQALAAELLFLGLYDEGSTELRLGGFGSRASSDADAQDAAEPSRFVQVAASRGGDVAYSLAVYSNRGDHAHYAIAFAEPVFKSIPQDYRLELLPRDLAELIYPAPYRDALNRYAPALDVDPRLVLSIARQESRFNPSVKSAATARGLLQFIPETALKLAQEEGMKNFELDDVYDPQVAIRLAARNLYDLFKLFPDNPHAVAASYNTYDTNVERWIFRSRSKDVDRFVAEIALPETKDYVAKVMSNYRAYRLLYTEDLQPRR